MYLKNKIALSYLLILFSVSFSVANNIEFDDEMLKGLGFENVDLSAFSGADDQFTGEYQVRVNLNGEDIAWNYPIYIYVENEKENVCFTETLFQKIAIKKEYLTDNFLKNTHATDVGICYDLDDIDKASEVHFSTSDASLNITIPQRYLNPVDPYWIAPSERDSGVAGVLLDYTLIWDYSRYKHFNYSRSSVISTGTTGINWGSLRFRADYQYNSEREDRKLDWTQIYAFTDLPSLNAKLYAGEIYTRSNIFDTTRVKGISIFSDEAMMPAYLQGYSPEISGVAMSNAVVTISQYGNILRTLQVPAGPFAISDLPSYVNGTVDVEVEETGGEVRRYEVDISRVPFLTRKGQFRYSANIGKLAPYDSDKDFNTKLISADGSFGLTNNLSLYGGFQSTTNSDYLAVSLGIGLNLERFGALSFDITRSQNGKIRSEEGNKYRGNSFRVNYAKRFSSSSTLNLAAYRFSSRQYTSLNNYLSYVDSGLNNLYLEKQRISISLTQALPQLDIHLTGSYNKSIYWNRESNSNYNFTVNRLIKSGWLEGSSMNLTFSQDRTGYNNHTDRRIGFYINIPMNIGSEERRINGSMQYNGQHSSLEKSIKQQVSYRGYLSNGDNFSIGASTQGKRDFSGSLKYSLDGTYNLRTGYGDIMTMANYSDSYKSVSASFDGSLTLTSEGLATHKRVYGDGSRLILDAGVSGVRVGSDQSNIFGLVGISNISSYYDEQFSVDNDNLPDNVEIRDGVVKVATNDGAIAFRSLQSISGEKAIARIMLKDGTHPPFGSVVKRMNGEDYEVGIIADDGLTFLMGANNKDTFMVEWHGATCQLQVKGLDPNSINELICD